MVKNTVAILKIFILKIYFYNNKSVYIMINDNTHLIYREHKKFSKSKMIRKKNYK